MLSSIVAEGPGAALLPRPDESTVVIAPPGPGWGYWAGAPSAALGDDGIYLAYRLRRPIGAGRGYATTVARSADGVRFETVATIHSDDVGAERLVVVPGDAKTGVKDPVISLNGTWQMWACCHPLADPAEADQMVSDYATSSDGIDWTWHGTALSGRPGYWDSRGARISAVCQDGESVVAFYDGRASAAENYEERTGVATGNDPASLVALGADPAAESPYAGKGLRYLDFVELPGGRLRLYYEMTRPDGAHELRTELRLC